MIKQATAITVVNLKSIPERWGSSLVIVIGLAGVVAVFTALLAMSEGFQSTLKATGNPDHVIVMRGGSQAELNSGLSRDDANLIRQLPGIRKGEDGKPVAAGEMIVITELLRPGGKTGSNLTLRGVEALSFNLRPNLRVVEGRMYGTGLRELIVGRGVTRQFTGADLGQTVRMRGSDWTVVGIFESGDSHESELWADVEVAQSTFGRTGVSVVRAVLDSADSLIQVQDAAKAEPRLNVDVQRETDYYSGQTRQFRQTIGILAGVVTVIMSLGAIFGALNTMYAAVAARTREIATLRAIGFGGLPVVVSVMVESMVLALLGGLVGAAIAFVLFNNASLSTLGSNFTQVVFSFRVTPGLVFNGLLIALVIGFFGGLFPAVRAARLQVTTALRAA